MSVVKWIDKNKPKLRAINLELTNFCNYRCTFCLNREDNFRSKGYISQELIEKVINELDRDVSISICGIGEPSLHPEFVTILRGLSNKFHNISIVTNGYLFRNQDLIDIVLESNIKKINLSLDYIDSQEYQNIKGGNLEQVLTYLKNFLLSRSQHKNKPLIQINYLYEKNKNDYLSAIEKLTSIMQDNDPWCIYIRKIKDLAGQVAIEEEKNEDFLDNILKDRINENVVVENWNRYLSHTNFQKDLPRICRHMYDYYMLLWNGSVVPCCVDFNSSMSICNVLKENLNLTDVFYNDGYNTFREKMESLDYRDYPLCRNCNDYYKA